MIRPLGTGIGPIKERSYFLNISRADDKWNRINVVDDNHPPNEEYGPASKEGALRILIAILRSGWRGQQGIDACQDIEGWNHFSLEDGSQVAAPFLGSTVVFRSEDGGNLTEPSTRSQMAAGAAQP